MPNQNNKNRQTRSQNNRQTQRKNRKKKKSGSIWKKIILSIFILGFLGLAAGGGLFFYYASQAPEIDMDALVDAEPTKLLDPDGELIKEVGAGAQNRDLVTLDEIPQVLQDAVLSIEDQRFYKHIGIDPIRIVGAVFANLRDGGISQGGSTITQQLIKLSHFSTSEEDQTLERKAQEAWMAIKLEQMLEKDEILALYINKVYLGNNVYGMGTAAEYYFGKELKDVTIEEAATLAGIPQAPSYYDPYVNPEETTERRNIVIAMMHENEKITEEERNQALNVSLAGSLQDHSNVTDNSLVIDAYLQVVADEVFEKTGLDIYAGGLTVQTNLDMDAQQHLYDIVNTEEYIAFPDDEIQTAATLIDTNTGAIRAIIGNRKNNHQMAINYADQTERDVASTIKPLIDFGPAIEYLDYSTGTLIVDEEVEYADGTPLRNYDNRYVGDMTIREALVDSRNVPALKLLREVGYDNAGAFLSKLGIDSPNTNNNDLHESNSIQGYISSIDLAAAYAAFANGGTYFEPYTVRSVTSSDGKVYDFEPEGSVAMKDSTAYMITDMLKDVITYSAPEAQISGLPQAGKTGTSDYKAEELVAVGAENVPNVGKDSWFVGYTKNHSLSVWLGYDQPLEPGNYMTYETRNITRYIYRELMGYVSSKTEISDWERPTSVVEASMEKYSSPVMKPGPNTPSNMRISELFVKGTEPTQVSKKYGEELKAPTGLKANFNQRENELTISWDEYKLSSDDNRIPQFTVTVGNQTQNITENKIVIKNPTPGDLTITLVAKVGSNTSPSASTKITIPKAEEEKEKEDEKDDEKQSSQESEESSSTSESSSESVDSESSSEESIESEESEESTEESSSETVDEAA